MVSTNLQTAYFAAGCFWGVEYYFSQQKGVKNTLVGYMGGHTNQPNYHDIKTGKTGHLEVVKIEYDPNEVNYESLVKLFFEIHDPTQKNGQGVDIGPQYLSALFYCDEQEKSICQRLITVLKSKGFPVVTKLMNSKQHQFWQAEDYHQQYFNRHQHLAVCHQRVKIFD